MRLHGQRRFFKNLPTERSAICTRPDYSKDARFLLLLFVLGVVWMAKLVDEPLRTFRLAHYAFFVVLPQTPGQLVVVHGGPVLASAPQTRHGLAVFDLEHALFAVQPTDHLLLLLLFADWDRRGRTFCYGRRGSGGGRRRATGTDVVVGRGNSFRSC